MIACRYGCCKADARDGKREIVRRNKRREKRAWQKEQTS
jgi:hypothetical protein